MIEKVTISVNEGKLQGFKSTSSFSGVEYYSFLGVPYGQSTAGFARFKDPVPVKPWKNILLAMTEKGGCLQFSLKKQRIDGSEDCLYNNIHTPKLPQKTDDTSLKPVIVLLHPGMYTHGSPDPEYFGSPDFVMHNDIVYVCASFRIHILGFLNLGLEECSGNQGLKDIILSLQWIQKNISNFGGDPNNVTLLGSSSGARIINCLMMSPRAKGLFHKSVIMGMYTYCPNSSVREENSTVAYEMAKNLGYKGTLDKKKLYLFYRRLDGQKLILGRPERSASDQDSAPFFPGSLFLETADYGENPVLPSSSKQETLESMMRIPIMIGFCQYEAAMGFLAPFRTLAMKNFYKSIRQNYLGWGSKLTDDQLQIIQKRVELHYLNGQPTENAPLTSRCDIQSGIALSDLYTSFLDVVSADLPSSVYIYKFEFDGNAIKLKDLFDFTFEERFTGTVHGDDFTHWDRIILPFEKKEDILEILTAETIEMIHKFTKLISTFARTGNPNYEGLTTEWKPTSVENPCYLSLKTDLRMVDGKLNGKSMDFWENIKEEFEKGDLMSV